MQVKLSQNLQNAIYKERVTKLRDTKIIDNDRFDLRSNFTENDKKSINRFINKYEHLIIAHSKDKLAIKKINRKQTRQQLDKANITKVNGRYFIAKTRRQKVYIKSSKNKITINKKIGKNSIITSYNNINILKRLKNIKLKDNQVIQLLYFGSPTKVFDNVNELIKSLEKYLKSELTNKMNKKEKLKFRKNYLKNFDYNIVTY